jgi:AAA domain, putative AbiEii toxin, Type IV TA system
MEHKPIASNILEKTMWRRFQQSVVIDRNRCFLALIDKEAEPFGFALKNINTVGDFIRQIIHLPGLRGNPERTYPITAVGPEFPGTFDKYFASVIGQWQSENNTEKLGKVNRDLARLGLTGGIAAEPIDDTQIELLVHRYSRKDEFDFEDMVSIADVGLGISQTLPVIVALHAASPDQLIYVEQPELHMHPRAQSAMAEVLADAAKEGARMVVETHSSLLLLGIQTLVAEGKLPPELVKLHWFQLLDDGSTQIVSADLDETGAFGDWPVDFADVALSSEGRYLDAAQARMMKGS